MPNILIADDSMFQRFMTTKIIKDMGFEVLEASNGQECVDSGVANDPDLIILDLNMPVKSGLEVLEELRTHGRTKPILIMTADIQVSTRSRCEEYGVHFLNKPVPEDVIRDTVLRLIGSA